MTTYQGIAAPQPSEWKPVNGSRGRRRQPGPITLAVLHLWVSPEDGPDRYLQQIATPSLPSSGRVFQSRSVSGQWYWETPEGTQTTDETKAKRFPGPRPSFVYRSGADPVNLTPGVSPMPWCYGAAYHCVAAPDGFPRWTCDPDLYSVNANPPVNDVAVSICMPGRYQSRHEWLNVGNSRQFIRAAARALIAVHDRFGVPLERLSAKDLLAGRHGYTDHKTVNDAWHKSDHGDVGPEFPWDVLAADINELLQGDDMPRIVNVFDDATWQQASPEAFVMSGPTLEWVQTLDQLGQLVTLGAASMDRNTGKPYGIWRSQLKNFRRTGAVWPQTPFAPSEFLPAAG